MTRSRRWPRKLERELGRLLSVAGFGDYGTFFWNMSSRSAAEDAVIRARLDPALVEELLGQLQYDPVVLPGGAKSAPELKRRHRTLSDVSHVSSQRLFEGLDRADAMIVAARLDTRGIEEVLRARGILREAGARSFIVVVSDQFAKKADSSLIKRLDGDHIVFWRDHYWADGYWAARLFAMFLHALGPAAVVSLRSRLGIETIGHFGKALKTSHRLFLKLDLPDASATLVQETFYLRLAAPHARIVTETVQDADALRAHASGLPNDAIFALENATVKAASIFGDDFSDPRSMPDQTVAATLLQRGALARPLGHAVPLPASAPSEVALTATIVLHRERELAVPALRSFGHMIDVARRDNIRVEARAMLDNADDATRALVATHGGFLDDVVETALRDPAAVRNAGAQLARGRFLAFFDGDDLWGANWLRHAYRAAERDGGDAVWHPEAYLLFYPSDCLTTDVEGGPRHRPKTELYFQQSSTSADFEPRDLLLESLWTVNAFAPRTVHMRYPYRLNDPVRQVGIEDWRWNLETLGHGLRHLVVPGTVHLIRMKDGGSVGQAHASAGLLPFLV